MLCEKQRRSCDGFSALRARRVRIPTPLEYDHSFVFSDRPLLYAGTVHTTIRHATEESKVNKRERLKGELEGSQGNKASFEATRLPIELK